MEFDLIDLDEIIINLFGEQETDEHDSNYSTTTKHSHTLNSIERQMENITTNNCDRQYCLIIFNNPSWSQILRKRSQQIKQRQQQMECSTDNAALRTDNSNKQDSSLDDQFVAQLRQLLRHYMQHTKRPFPLKYFLDLTDQ